MNEKSFTSSHNQAANKNNFHNLFDKCLLMEYKYVQKFCPLGIYIIPDHKNLKIWNGVIYLKEGLYQQGIFKFIIKIPNLYPSEIPQLLFVNKIIHPLVDKDTGSLDLKKKFNDWIPGKNLIVHVLFYLKNIFYNPIYLQEENSFNPECSKLFTEDLIKLKEEIKKLCENSYQDRFNHVKKLMHGDNSGQEMDPANKMNQLFLDKLCQQSRNSDLSLGEKIMGLKKWFRESYVELVKEKK